MRDEHWSLLSRLPYDQEVTSQARADWLAQLLSTEPADRAAAESALGDLYAAAGFAAPRVFFWFDGPFPAALAVELLSAPHNVIHQMTVQALEKKKLYRGLFEQVRADL